MHEAYSLTALWWAVILSGIYHGINPGMGWPLAVSSALMERRRTALAGALGALALGHLAAMLVILLPFSTLTILVTWEREIRLGAGLIVIAMGVFLLIYRKHPRFLARIPPTRLALWSFLAALAHGAALMLVPIFLGICRFEELDAGHQAAGTLMANNLTQAVLVALAHTAAMTLAGGLLAAGVYFWLGLKAIAQTWFNLDIVWALSLIIVGVIGVWSAWY